ncbi:MerR family transcriptional regulator [Tahibacter amnicola]|uniref:MerR family transcriptional regulator n=1 Tax=Tahibacter amnicola TaxID=2976241 RepID=A0ABY6BJ77_9GAMM|nr:MerR family transcriptional regulator [Tahibacter amnicola]UXI70068.1 MerR family transcriptional regulator [Tahibacter amnicola]
MSNSPSTAPRFLRIGELAERGRVSAKALRLYEQRGLLRPSTHSAAGYRLYGAEALARLHQIVLLKQSGFALGEIARLLERDPRIVATLLAQRIHRLEQELEQRTQALDALRQAAHQVDSASTLSIDALLENLSMTKALDVSFTAEEREALRGRAAQLGTAALAASREAWPALISKVRAAMQAGLPPHDPSMAELARQWHALVTALTGGDVAVTRKLSQAYAAQPQAMAERGLDPALFAYVGAAMSAIGLSLPQ